MSTLTLEQTSLLLESASIGKNIKPRKDIELLKGTASFTDDIKLPNMVYAAFLRSPYGHARIKDIDISKAAELPGVVYVLTGRESAKQLVSWMIKPGLRTPERPSLATDKVRFVGEPIAVVAATSRAVAEDAVELIEVEYEPLPAVVDAERAMQPGAPVLFEDWGDNVLYHEQFHSPGTDEVFKNADFVIKERLTSNRYSPTPMENRAILASYDPNQKTLLVYASTQFPHVLRTFLAQTLEFPEHKIRVIAPKIGGGFGIKSAVFQDEVTTVILSLKLGRPVKWIEDRKEHLLMAGHERQQVHYVECAVKKDGTLLGVRDKIIADFGSGGAFWTEVQPAMLTCASIPGPYKFNYYDFDLWCMVTNKGPTGPHRGFGRPVAAYVMERMMDIIARKLRMSPVEIRLKNMIDVSDMPWTTPIGILYDTGDYKRVLRQTVELGEFDKFRERQARLLREGKFVGQGLATYVEYTAPSSSRLQGPLGWAVGGWESCRLTADPSGKITAQLGTSSTGQAHETVFAQVISDALGVKLEDIEVLEGDTQHAPYGWGAWASRSTTTTGGACIKASRKMKDKVLIIASDMLKEPPENLVMKDSQITSKSDPNKTVSFQEVCDVAIRFSSRLPTGLEPGLDVISFYEPDVPTTCSYATHLVEVEVDAETGYVRLLKYFIVDDSGVLVNPMTAHGQVHGALAHGIGGAMFEDLVYDRDGQLLSSTFMDYLLPTAEVMPPILEVDSIETPSLTLGGFKGLGEGAAIPTAGAIANAVDDALASFGVKFVDLPITPEKVRYLIESSAKP